MSQAAVNEAPQERSKDASHPVIAQHQAVLAALPFSNKRYFAEAARGFLGTIEQSRLMHPSGRTVWSLEPYGFLSSEEAPPTVNPSLWRQARPQHAHGLL